MFQKSLCNVMFHVVLFAYAVNLNISIKNQCSHNMGKFPQIFAVSMGFVLGMMRILSIPFKLLLFG